MISVICKHLYETSFYGSLFTLMQHILSVMDVTEFLMDVTKLNNLHTVLPSSTKLKTSLNTCDLPSVRLPTEGTIYPQTWFTRTSVILYQHFICGFKYYTMKGSNWLYYTILTVFSQDLVSEIPDNTANMSLTPITGQYSLLEKTIAQV